MDCSLRDRIKNGINNNIDNALLNSKSFNKEDNIYIPLNINHENIVSLINESYNESVVKNKNNQYYIDIPESLIDIYENEKTGIKVLPYKTLSNEDFNDILTDLKLEENATLEDYKGISTDNSIIDMLKISNPNVKLEFSRDSTSNFSPRDNTVSISLEEVKMLSLTTNLPIKQTLEFLVSHELTHASTYFALKNGKNNKKLSDIRDILLELHKTNPFYDTMRNGYTEDGIPYSLSSVDEMVADSTSNPFFSEWLKTNKEGNESFLTKLLNSILEFFGLNKKSFYNEMMDVITNGRFLDTNNQGLIDLDNSLPTVLIEMYGLPRSYIQETYDFFTSTNIADSVRETIKNIPTAIIKLKSSLDKETDKEKRKLFQQYIDSFDYSKNEEGKIVSSLNMIFQASVYSKDLLQRVDDIKNITDKEQKLIKAAELKEAAQSLSFLEPFAKDLAEELEGSSNILLKGFLQQMNGIVSTRAIINNAYNKIVRGPIIESLSELTDNKELYDSYTKRMEEFEDKKNKTNSLKEKEMYGNKIKQLIKERSEIPSPEYYKKVFDGEGIDSSAYQIYLSAPIQNRHNVVSGIMDIIQKNNQRVSQRMINVTNLYQTQIDKLKKALSVKEISNVNDFYKDITDEVEFAMKLEEDENGNLNIKKKITQRMLLSEYESSYIKDYFYKNKVVEFYYSKLQEFKNNEELSEKYKNLLDTAKKEKYDFEEKNSERRYTDNVYEMYKIFDKALTKDDGTQTTFGKERLSLFEKIEDYQRTKESLSDLDELSKVQEVINHLQVEVQQLQSIYDKNGTLKVGFEKDLTDAAIKYRELRKEYGDYILTDTSKAAFEKDVLHIKKLLEEKRITQQQYNSKMSEISSIQTTDEFKDLIKNLQDSISSVAEEISLIPEFRNIFSEEEKNALKEGYEKLSALTKGFRDDDFVVDGITFSNMRPNLIAEVKFIQETLDKIKDSATKLKSLSKTDSTRMNLLFDKIQNKTSTDEESAEYTDLKTKLSSIKDKYEKNKTIIDRYSKLTKLLGELYDNKETSYYERESKRQYDILLANKKKDLLVKLSKIEKIGNFRKIDGEWTTLSKSGTKDVYVKIDMSNFSSNEEAAAHFIAIELLKTEWQESDWFKNNHYEKLTWEDGKMISMYKAIYIWTQSIPKDEKYISPEQPSIKYKTYKIKAENINNNFDTMNDGIPLPKSTVYRNKRYEDLKSNTAYFDMLSFLKEDYRKTQKFLPENKKMYDILPSLTKTNDELQTELLTKIKSKAVALLAKAAVGNEGSDDEKIVTGGSTTNYYAKNKILPVRFVSKMDKEHQSSDIIAMMLAFNISSLEYNENSKDKNLLEAIVSLAEELDVNEIKNLAGKLSLSNLFNFLRNKNVETKTSQKNTDKSNLSRDVKHITDTFLYGETKFASHSTILGMDVDWHKMSGTAKRISSFSIFAFNAFSGVKNTFTATIMGYIHSNVSKGYYSFDQYSRGHAEAILFTKDLLNDFNKFGNKSKIGQELDFFQILEGSAYNMYGKKTAFSTLKNVESGITAFKASSEIEIQVAQYLAMSKANLVEVDGKMVEFREAFEIKDGIFKIKDGVNLSQKEIDKFINRVLNLNRTINGAYRHMEKNALQKHVLGDLAFYLNGYLVPGFEAAFGAGQYSMDGGIYIRGFHSENIKFIGDLFKYRTGIANTWHTLSEEEKSRVIRSNAQLLTIVMFFILMKMLGGYDKKEQLKDNSTIHNWMIAVTLGVKSELESFIPLPGFGLNELARKMNSPFAALRQITGLINLIENFSLFLVDDPKAFYTANGIKDGWHDKGDVKAIANFFKLVGYSGVGTDAIGKIQQVKQSQQLR